METGTLTKDTRLGFVLSRIVSSRYKSKASQTMEHHASDRRHFSKTSAALRTVAMFEVTKGAIVLLLGCGLFHLMHKNLDEVIERVVQVLHVNPEGKLSNLFLELASHASDRKLWMLALEAAAQGYPARQPLVRQLA
jgi:hypothetical protein